jgi:hypothetical protein
LKPNVGERFNLDAWLIQDLSSMWSSGVIKLPQTILPLYGSEWMWQKLPWIQELDGSGQRLYAITFKGRDQVNSICLLEYPWLCHELGHALFSKAPALFLQDFVKSVKDYCRPISRKAFSDSSEVRALTKSHIGQIQQRWMPRGDQQSWIHEIAVDIISLWSCGPAFLAAMLDVATKAEPFIVDSPHPPYALRLKMLTLCADNLGWQNESKPLAELESRWASAHRIADHNQYLALCPDELIRAALDWATRACVEWKIPKCKPDHLINIKDRRRKNYPIDSANELIISAWLMFDNNEGVYQKWESTTIRALCDDLNGDA